MIFAIVLTLLALLTDASTSHAAIYGLDDRRDVVTDPWATKMASGTAMLISPVFTKTDAAGKLSFDFPRLDTTDSYNVCKEEKFASQPSAYLGCTGFLISPTLLVTAGHCMVNTGEMQDTVNPQCRDFQWLLDYRADLAGHVPVTGVAPSNVVGCKRLVYAIHSSTYDPLTKLTHFDRDFAIVELDRPVTGRPYFKLATGFVQPGDRIAKIGYPLGQAAKVTGGGTVVEVMHPQFARTTMDAVGGDSGGPVVSAKNGEVVGILVRAFPDDFYEPRGRDCQKFNVCTQDLKSCKANDFLYPVGSQIQNVLAISSKLKELGLDF
ncbi:MAG: serine protease [Bdellovibrionota bacterium]